MNHLEYQFIYWPRHPRVYSITPCEKRVIVAKIGAISGLNYMNFSSSQLIWPQLPIAETNTEAPDIASFPRGISQPLTHRVSIIMLS